MSQHEEVLQGFNRTRLNEEAVNVEKIHFYKTDKKVNPKQEEPFLVLTGRLPVLVSVPHAVRHYRHKKIKMSDQFTGSIAFLLHKLTDCHIIAATKLYGGDPNIDNPCIYKQKICDICSQEKVKCLFDMHGAAREQEFDVDLGTINRKTLLGQNKMLAILDSNFQVYGLGRVSYDHFAPTGSNSVTNYVARELRIPAVQIEINKQYRVPAQNPQGFHRLMGALMESVKMIAKY